MNIKFTKHRTEIISGLDDMITILESSLKFLRTNTDDKLVKYDNYFLCNISRIHRSYTFGYLRNQKPNGRTNKQFTKHPNSKSGDIFFSKSFLVPDLLYTQYR